jgi:hypothetical protein
VSNRHVRRLALAVVLVAIVGISSGLDTAFAVALSLVVMEVNV